MGHPNHRWPLPSKFWIPSKNHWFQWVGPQKTFNGDGPMLSKPLNHWSQWWPEKNINHSIALKNWPSFWSNPDCPQIERLTKLPPVIPTLPLHKKPGIIVSTHLVSLCKHSFTRFSWWFTCTVQNRTAGKFQSGWLPDTATLSGTAQPFQGAAV